MIELKNISKTFNRNTSDPVRALNGISLVIEKGSFTVVVGANGSGKTTLLNILAGTLREDEGKVVFDRTDVTGLPDFRRSKWIARIFQNPLMGTSPELTILENFRLAALRTKSKSFHTGTGEKFNRLVKEKIASLQLGLEGKINQPMGTLSGGQRQALTLLMAVMDETKILLMDEPTAALDPGASKLVLKLADRLIREMELTVLFITHHLKFALNYGDRLIRMNDGKIVNDLDKEDKSKLVLADLYKWFE